MTATLPGGLEYKNLMAAAEQVADGVWGSEYPEEEGVRNLIVAVTGVRDEVGDIIVPGAFEHTLQRLEPKACLGHDWNRVIGYPEAIKELLPGDPRLPKTDRHGRPWPAEAGALFARTRYHLDTDDGQRAYKDARFLGPRLACSIGYVDPKDDNGKPLYSYKKIDPVSGLMTRFLPRLDLFEYSQVLHGAHLLAGGVKDGKPTRLELKDRPDMELKVRLVRDSSYWGLPLGTPIRPGMKPQGPKAQRITETGGQADVNAGAVEVDANNLRIKRTARGKRKGPQAISDAFSSVMDLLDTADPIDDEQAFVDNNGDNPLDILVANGLPPAEVEEDLRDAQWNTGRLGQEGENQDEIDSFIASVVDSYREKYNAELVRQNDNGDSEVADPDAAAPEPEAEAEASPDTRTVNEVAEDDKYERAVERFNAAQRGEIAPPQPESAEPSGQSRISPEDQAEITRLKQDGRDNEAAKLYREALARARAAEGITPEQLSPTRARLRQQGAIPLPPADPNAPPPAGLDVPQETASGQPRLALHNGDPVSVRENDGTTANVYNMRTEQAYDVPADELLTGGASAEAPVVLKLNDAQREAADLVFGNGEPIEDSGAELTGAGLTIADVAEAVNTIDTRMEIFEDNPDQKRRHGRVIKAMRAKIVKLAKPGEPAESQPAAAETLPDSGTEVDAPSTGDVPEGASEESIVEPGLAPDTAGEPLGEAEPALADPAPVEPGTELPVDESLSGELPAEQAAPEPTEQIGPDELADTEEAVDASFGVAEAPDGEFEADADVADRQDRVATLLAQSETGSLDLSRDRVGDDQLRTTRADIVDELRLQQHLERRRGGKPAVTRQRAEQDEAEQGDSVTAEVEEDPGPKPRPGVAGAAEDLADALESGSDDRIDAATSRFRTALNRSRSDSPVVAELRAMLDPLIPWDAEALRDTAARLREEQRAKRNEGARRRRTARRFERERLRSLLGQVETEMRNRDLDFDPIPDEDDTDVLGADAPVVGWESGERRYNWANSSDRVDTLTGSGYSAEIVTHVKPDGSTVASEYQWAVTNDDDVVLASGKGTAANPDTARTSIEIALAAQQRLGLIPVDAQIPQGSVPQNTSATPLADVVDALDDMRARIIDNRRLNPITGEPDPFGDGLTPLPVPETSRFDDADAVRKHLEIRGQQVRGGGNVTTLYRWDTAKMTPGGAFVIVDDLKGKPQVVHAVSGGSFAPPMIAGNLGRADMLRYAEILESLTDRDGQPIDWSLPPRDLVDSFSGRSFVADKDGLRGMQEAAVNRLTKEKIQAGQFTHKLVLRDMTFTDGITNPSRKRFVEDQHRTLAQLINVTRGKPNTFDKKTLDAAAGARTLAAMGAPDAAAVLLTRRATEVRAQYETDAPSHGSAVLDALATGYLGMFSPMRSHGERVQTLKPGEQVFLAEKGEDGGLRSFRALSAPRRDPRGGPSETLTPVIDEKTGQQMFLRVGPAEFRIEENEDVRYGFNPLSADLGGGLFAVVGPGEEPPGTVDDLKARQFDDASAIPQDVLDAAAEVLPETAGETAARRATPTGGARPPRRRSPAAPRRTAPAAAAPEPVPGEQHLAAAQGRAEGRFLGMPFTYSGDTPRGAVFEDMDEVREHLTALEVGASDPKVASSARAVLAELDDRKLSPGGVFLVAKDGYITHISSSMRVWPPSAGQSPLEDLEAGGYRFNQAAGLRVARALESGVFDGEQLDWSGNGRAAVKQINEISKRNSKFHALRTAQRAAYRDGVLGAAKPGKTDVAMFTGMANQLALESPNPEAFDRSALIDDIITYEGSRGFLPNTKAGGDLAKRVAVELRMVEPLSKVAPLDAVRRLTRLADELDGQTITTSDPGLSRTPSDDLRAAAKMITDVYDPDKISESGRFRQAGMVGQVELTKPKITMGRSWEDPNGIAARNLESDINASGGIRFYRDENGVLHATFDNSAGVPVDIADGQVQVGGGTTGAIKLTENGALTLSYLSANRLIVIEAPSRSWKFTPERNETDAEPDAGVPGDGDTSRDIAAPEAESAQAGTGDGVDVSEDMAEIERLASDESDADTPGTDLTPEQIEARIRKIYGELADGPQDWIRLARVRAQLGGMDRAQVDEVLKAMAKTDFVHLAPESATRALTDEDRDAALRVGSEDVHLIAIE